jgi:hypothetical protein
LKKLVFAGLSVACGRIAFDDRRDDALSRDALDAPAGAITTIIGSDRATDTYIVTASNVGDNYGALPFVQMNGAPATRSLMRFEVSMIPTTATVFSAEIHLNIDQADTTSPITVSRVLEDWLEGTGTGTPGVANWNERMPGVLWTGQGANAPGSTDAIDFNSWLPSYGAGVYDVPFDTATAQGWITAPSTNFGFLMRCSSFQSISSREATIETTRPTLTIVWVP